MLAQGRFPSAERSPTTAVRERPRLVPVPLDEVPEIAEFLTGLDLGVLRQDAVTAFFGRNDSWAGVTDTGVPVFVKRTLGEADLVRLRVNRTMAMGELLNAYTMISTP